MKKKLTAMLLAGLLTASLASFAGCGDKKEEAAENTDEVLLNDFEEFEKDVQLIRLLNGFGVVNHNKDKTYVKSGDCSIQLRPKGYNYSTVPPYLVLPTYSTRFEYGYGDFTQVESISMWFYNAEEEEIEVGVGLLTGAINNGQWYATASRCPAGYFMLKEGWNHIEYDVLPSWLELHSSFDIDEVHGIYVECPYSGSFDIEDSPTLYMDEVRLHYTQETRSNEINIDLKHDEEKGVWEIADFESSYENMAFTTPRTGSANPKSCVPTTKVVDASKHSVITTDGSGVLEITLRAGTGEYGWPFIYCNAEFMQYAFKKVGKDLVDNPQNYEIKFDLFNAQNFKQGLTLYLKTADGKDAIPYGTSVKAEPHSWTTFSYNIGKLNDNSPNKDYAANPGTLQWASAQYPNAEDTSDRYILIDNIRIEKIA